MAIARLGYEPKRGYNKDDYSDESDTESDCESDSAQKSKLHDHQISKGISFKKIFFFLLRN